MNRELFDRRTFLKSSAAMVLVAPKAAYLDFPREKQIERPASKNEHFGIGLIGARHMGSIDADNAGAWGDVVAICDVDRQIAEKAREHFGGKAALSEDYRKLLDRKDVDVVIIGTPDHWHTAMAAAACRAGKDV